MATSYEKQRKAREKAAKKAEKQRLKDEKTAQKTSNVRKLGALAENSASAAARVSAIARLKSRGAQAALLSLAENSSQAPVRCEAAWLLEDQEKAREILSGSIAEAFGDSGMTKDYHFREWTGFVPNDEQLLKAYRKLKDGSLAQALWPVFARKHSAVLREILAEAVMWFPTVEEILKIYTGSREDWRYLAEHNKNTGTTAEAVKHLTLEDADVLTRIADKGSRAGADRLAELDPAAYLNRYADKITPDKAANAIKAHRLNQEALLRVALAYPSMNFFNSPEGYDAAEAALDSLTDPALLARLLLEKKAEPRIPWSAFNPQWFSRLVEKLADQQDTLAEYIITGNKRSERVFAAEQKALDLITDENMLYKIAASDCGYASTAVRRLGADRMKALSKEAKQQSVRQYATTEALKHGIADADEEELLEALHWSLYDSPDEALMADAASRLTSQDALLKALDMLTESMRTSAKNTVLRLLPRITDGESLMKYCLEKRVVKDTVFRLKELIGGSPLEDRFVSSAKASDSFRLLEDYFRISAEEAIWKYGGTDYIRRVMDSLEKEEDLGEARTKANQLAWIYRHIPQSQGILDPYKGKHYRKHIDFDAYCASESCHTYVDMEFKL